MTDFMTVPELVGFMARRGKTISAGLVRYHCTARSGLLYGHAEKRDRMWIIPETAAATFAETWEPYITLKRQK